MNKFVSLLFLLSFLTSCQKTGDKQQLSKEERLESELDKINWTEVDTYPVFNTCDSIIDTQQQKKCFIATMSSTLQNLLKQDTLQGNFNQIDSLKILVTILPNSTVHLKVHQIPDSLLLVKEKIDSLLTDKGKSFPILTPATKQGIPVTSGFIIPVVVSKN